MGETKPKKFASDDLKQYDGLDGRPLYIVFKGKVYDLTGSKLWPQGKHMGMHTRTEDLAEAIKKAPHGEDNVFRYPLVGELLTPAFRFLLPRFLMENPLAASASCLFS